MSNQKHFHGSDLEAIEKYYHIPKESILGFGANVNPYGLSDSVRKALQDNLDLITKYPDRNYVSLRKILGTYCSVDSDHIIVGNGATELISLLIQHRHPKRAMLIGPTYSEYERELQLCGGEIVPYDLSPENDFQLLLSDLFQALENSIDLLILCNPNNPTSTAIPRTELELILQKCKELNIFVMIDETYVEFVPFIEEITAMPLTECYDNVMVLRGVSKFFAAPGLRFGYGVTSSSDFLQVIHANQNPWSLNILGAFAGELFFQDTEYISKSRTLIQAERERVYAALQEITGLHPFQPIANFILVRIDKEGISSFDVFEHLIKKGIMIRDCASFACLKEEYIRFCFLFPEENDRLLEGLRELFL